MDNVQTKCEQRSEPPVSAQPVHWELKSEAVCLFCEKLSFSVVGHGWTESVWRLALRPRSGAASCCSCSSSAFNRWLTSTSGPPSEPRRADEGFEAHRRQLTGADIYASRTQCQLFLGDEAIKIFLLRGVHIWRKMTRE